MACQILQEGNSTGTRTFGASNVTSDKGPMSSCLMIITCHPLMADDPAGAAHFHNLMMSGAGGHKLPRDKGPPEVKFGKWQNPQGPASLGLLQTLAQPGSLYPSVWQARLDLPMPGALALSSFLMPRPSLPDPLGRFLFFNCGTTYATWYLSVLKIYSGHHSVHWPYSQLCAAFSVICTQNSFIPAWTLCPVKLSPFPFLLAS